jgi:hypothetical protein
MRLRLALTFLFATLSSIAFGACSSETSTQETKCDPGEEIFCKCRGGGSGTKTCLEDGNSFGACAQSDGECTEIPDETTVSSSNTTGDPSTTTGEGAGTPGSLPLLAPCTADTDCASGLCPMGFCTKDCATWQECTDADTNGECVRVNGGANQWCVPYCDFQDCSIFGDPADCLDCGAYGANSLCGYTLAVDGEDFTVCADWGSELALPPNGTTCDVDPSIADFYCHLGHSGGERVCAFGECTDGCHEDQDCPGTEQCAISSSLGACN